IVQVSFRRPVRTQALFRPLERPGTAAIPTPGQAQLPGAAVRTEQRTEGAELKPPYVELRRQLVRRNETPGIRAPPWNSAQANVDSIAHLGRERVPGGIDVSRPQPPVALQTRIAVAMQCKRTPVRM